MSIYYVGGSVSIFSFLFEYLVIFSIFCHYVINNSLQYVRKNNLNFIFFCSVNVTFFQIIFLFPTIDQGRYYYVLLLVVIHYYISKYFSFFIKNISSIFMIFYLLNLIKIFKHYKILF